MNVHRPKIRRSARFTVQVLLVLFLFGTLPPEAQENDVHARLKIEKYSQKNTFVQLENTRQSLSSFIKHFFVDGQLVVYQPQADLTKSFHQFLNVNPFTRNVFYTWVSIHAP